MSANLPVAGTQSVSIVSFGAISDGVTNNQAQIQKAFDYAATNGFAVYIPPGNFAYSGTITANGIAVYGDGASSKLTSLDYANESLTLTGSGGSVSNLQLTSGGQVRLPTWQASMIWIDQAKNYTIQNVLVNGSSGAGIFDDGGTNGLIQNNTVQNTMADAITNTNGASNTFITGNLTKNGGDDGISTVSYSDAPIVQGITVTNNTVIVGSWGRGISVVGGNNELISGNYIQGGSAGMASVYIAAEHEYHTLGVNNVTVTGNIIVNGGGPPSGTGQGAVTIYNSQGNTYSITGVAVTGNQIVNPLSQGFQFVGNGPESVVVTNNNVYTNGIYMTSNGNPNAIISMSGNQMLSPSLYAAPQTASGGGVTATPPLANVSTTPATTLGAITGSSPDMLVLLVSEDAYLGDANFTVAVDNHQLGGTFAATTARAAGSTEAFIFSGNWAPGSHSVTVSFLNDAYGGSASTDRNLYVNSIVYNGTNTGQSGALLTTGSKSFLVQDQATAVATVAASTTAMSIAAPATVAQASSAAPMSSMSASTSQ